MANEKLQSVTITPTMVSIFTQNVGATFTPAILTGIFRDDFEVYSGCIEHFFYGFGDDDLGHIRIVRTHPASVGAVPVSPVNIKDFRDRLREAACCRQCISFCVGKKDRKMFMLNVFPCKECKPSEECDCPA
jgi:hypothetical protein